jgi:predicted RNA-binding protein with PIN domain
VARVVERDDEFRARVAAAVDEDEVGRAGRLWLARPPGWEDELAALEAAAATEAAGAAEAREERSASRKLAAATAAAQRAEAQAATQLAELEDLRARLADERAARSGAEHRVVELEARAAELAAARAEAVRKLKQADALLVDRGTELNALKARLRSLEEEVRHLRDRATGGGSAEGGDDDAVNRRRDGEPVAGGETTPRPTPPAATPGSTPAAAPSPALDPTEVAAEVARAAAGAAGLSEALASLARLLGGEPGPRPEQRSEPGSEHDAAPAVGEAAARRDAPPSGPQGSGAPGAPGAPAVAGGAAEADAPDRADPVASGHRPRVPVALPGGLFDDTVEAAEHLLRTPGAVLVVDGYNVTMAGWPELGAADQRRRLVVALSDLAARTATRVEVVFDGAEVEPLSIPRVARQLVRVRFSEPGVEADDVVIDLVSRIPASTPVVVASSDKRVRAGARRGGANLLHARQLVAVLRR